MADCCMSGHARCVHGLLVQRRLAHLPPRIVRKCGASVALSLVVSTNGAPRKESAVDDLDKRKTVRHTMTWSRSHDGRRLLGPALAWRFQGDATCRAAARATSASWSCGYVLTSRAATTSLRMEIGDALRDSASGCPWCPTGESRRACSMRSCPHITPFTIGVFTRDVVAQLVE